MASSTLSPPPLDDEDEFTTRWRNYFRELNNEQLIQLLDIDASLPYNQIEFNIDWLNWMRELHRALAIIEIDFPQAEPEWSYIWTNYHRVIYNYLKNTNIISSNTTVDSTTPLYNYVDASSGAITLTMGTPSGRHKFIRIDDSGNSITFDASSNAVFYKGVDYGQVSLVEQKAAFTLDVNGSSNWFVDNASKAKPSGTTNSTGFKLPGSEADFSSGEPWNFGDGSITNSNNDGPISRRSDSDGSVELFNSRRLRGYNYGFTTTNIPSGSIIEGIEVRYRALFDANDVGSSTEIEVYLLDGTSLLGSNRSEGVNYEVNTYNNYTRGGSSDLWGNGSLDEDFVRSSSFGAMLRVEMEANVLTTGTAAVLTDVDYIQINVYYTVNELDIFKGDFKRTEPTSSVC